MNKTREETGPGTVKLTISVPPAEYEKHLQRAAKRLGEKITIHGFRKGHAPYETIKRHVGEMELLSSALDDIIADTLKEALQSDKGDIALQPRVQVTKSAPGNTLEYIAELVIAPKALTLPDFSTIVITKKSVEVSESAVDELIETIRKMRAAEIAKEGVSADGGTVELNDEFAQSLNKEFTTVAVLRQRMRENLIMEAEHKEAKRVESEMFERVLEQTTFSPIARELVAHTTKQLIAEIKASVSRQGASWADYLSKIKKDEKDLEKELNTIAENRIKRETLITHVLTEQKLSVSDEEAQREAHAVLSQFASPKEAQKKVDPQKLTAAIYANLLERKAVDFLKSKILK